MNGASPTIAEFIEGWQLGIYRDPILCGAIAGLVLGYVGVFVVLRRMVFVTAAVSQAAGLGVALAFFASIHLGIETSPVLLAIVFALIASALLVLRPERFGLSREAILGVTYLASWAAAVIIGARISQEAHDVSAILFGTAVVVRPLDLELVAGVGGAVLLLYLWFHRALVFTAYDREGARVQGLPVTFLELLAWTSVALIVSVTTRALGVLPVFAFAVLPAMAALVLAQRLRWVLALAAFFGALSGSVGYLIAFLYELPVGAAQAAFAAFVFLLVLPLRAAIPRWNEARE